MTSSAPRITAAGLEAYIDRVELPARLAETPRERAEAILRHGRIVGSGIDHHARLDRAMSLARTRIGEQEEAGRSVASGTTIIADRLTSSRGRFVRTWHAPPGGLWGTVIYVSTLLPASRLLLPLAVGVAGCEALRASGAGDAAIRWVNDVLLGGRKVAGFLLEGFAGPVSREEYTLIGFGLNVNNRDFPADLTALATSLRLHLDRPVDSETFAYCFLAKLRWNLGLLSYEEDLLLREEQWSGGAARHPLLVRWSELSDSLGRRVVFGFDVLEKPQYRATVTGIGEDGGLQLRLDDGSTSTEYSGEIRYLD